MSEKIIAASISNSFMGWSVISVALDVEGKDEAQTHVETARKELAAMDIEVVNAITCVGTPVDEIIDAGTDYSVIVLSDSGKKGLKRLFMGSVATKVLQEAYTSVMVVR